MVRAVDSNTYDYLHSRQGVIPRAFVWISAKNRETGSIETVGFWNGLDSVEVSVISGVTGSPVSREYHAAGSLLDVGPITRTPELEVRTLRISLSQISEAVQLAVRGYDVRHAPIEIHEGYLDRESRLLIAPPIIDFVGWINGAPINTPAAGGKGSIMLDCVSHSRMLTRTNPAKKSHETQKRRSNDQFRKYNSVANQWQYWWGEREGETMG
ncbi:hypothetical protein SAMN05892877_1653 [Rhizobium subbaraonis]|uniref:Uncharacterized protein n=2 Tax=Rhizobium subbaraonis TaxID=908946 RepID=A0A285V330_9HYPH|nr:hypothetical protein [Rhizobium subbaraonis]SOC48433.1 hypothetical protein SAMN05892877_1653 [Rhizobium subbaraonis]